VRVRNVLRVGSVRIRTTVAAATVVGIALFGVSFWLVEHQRSSLTENIQSTAVLRAQDLVSALQEGTLPTDLAVQVEDSSFVQVINDQDQVVAASINITGEPPIDPHMVDTDKLFFHTIHDSPAGDSAFRVVAISTSTSAGTFTIYVGASLEPVTDGTNSLTSALFIAMPLLVLLVGLITWQVVGLALRPVEEITQQVFEITANDLHRRVPEPTANDEISNLAKTMNKMLERLDRSDQQQRAFIGNVSHELRSPLAGIRAQLEVHQAHPNTADWNDVARDVLDEVARMDQLISDMLLLATVDAGHTHISFGIVEIDQVVMGEVKKIQQNSAITFDTSVVLPARVQGSELHLARLIRNLLENAERFAHTTIRVHVLRDADSVRVEIADDGPGIPVDALELIFERFTRLDESRARPDGGAGLGLSVVREIAALHHATVSIHDNDPGARFVVEFATQNLN